MSRSLGRRGVHVLRQFGTALAAAATLGCLLWSPTASAQGGGGQPVPVTVTRPMRRDVPVLARGIGTVQPLQNILVRARVDGTLDRVFFTEGQEVKTGDLLAQIDPRPYQAAFDQALAKKAADEAQLTAARADLVRYTTLEASQAASRQRFDQVRAQVAQLEATVKGDDAAIAMAGLNLSFTKITAPMDGRVGLRLLDPGNLIRVADPNGVGLVTLSQIKPVALLFTLPQDTLPAVQAALRAPSRPKVLAYTSDDRTLLAEGELLTVDNAIDAATGTIKLKAVFPNGESALWPGQFVNARLQLQLREGVLTVPSVAVNRGVMGLYAYVVKADGTVAAQPLDVVQDDGQVAVVAKGLEAETQVVVAGQSRLANGTRVSATEAKPGA